MRKALTLALILSVASPVLTPATAQELTPLPDSVSSTRDAGEDGRDGGQDSYGSADDLGSADRVAAQVAQGTDVDGEARFVDALAPRGARILDIPCGGGVALRGQRDIDGLGDEDGGIAFGEQRRTARLIGFGDAGARDVHSLARVRLLLLGQGTQPAPGEGDRRLVALMLDLGLGQRVEIRRGSERLLSRRCGRRERFFAERFHRCVLRGLVNPMDCSLLDGCDTFLRAGALV